ncbi:hypothetical protein ACJD0Z_04515 [Flavobacteriaceae bacterium M23B6Z8]
MERIVIVAYKPHKGKNNELKSLAEEHWDTLNTLGLVSERKPILMEAEDGTIIEVFGWKSKMAMEKAHSHPKVLTMWKAYAEVCEYLPVAQIPEAANLFSEFSPIT